MLPSSRVEAQKNIFHPSCTPQHCDPSKCREPLTQRLTSHPKTRILNKTTVGLDLIPALTPDISADCIYCVSSASQAVLSSCEAVRPQLGARLVTTNSVMDDAILNSSVVPTCNTKRTHKGMPPLHIQLSLNTFSYSPPTFDQYESSSGRHLIIRIAAVSHKRDVVARVT